MGTHDSRRSEDISPELAAKLAEAPFIIGSDETGLGAWAGPLVVVGVLVPGNWVPPEGLTDSKNLTEKARERLFDRLAADRNVRQVLSEKSSNDIDKEGVGKALVEMHQRIHLFLRQEAPDAVCIADGNLSLGHGIISAPRADGNVAAVSAASVIAKVVRDRMMVALDSKYPGYGLMSSKGYGTEAHQEALRRLGPCPEHRRSYAPIRQLLEEREATCTWEMPEDD